MDRMATICVDASRLAIRHQAAIIFCRFLIFYPMGTRRLEHHLRQAIANMG